MKLFLAGLILLTSCSPAALLRRADRLTKKAIAKGAIIKNDTIYKIVHDTIQGAAGTSNPVDEKRDTVEVQVPGRGTVQVVTVHDTIHHTKTLTVQLPPITVEKKVPVTVIKTISAPPSNKVAPWWRTAAIIFFILLAIIVYLLINKLKLPGL